MGRGRGEGGPAHDGCQPDCRHPTRELAISLRNINLFGVCPHCPLPPQWPTAHCPLPPLPPLPLASPFRLACRSHLTPPGLQVRLQGSWFPYCTAAWSMDHAKAICRWACTCTCTCTCTCRAGGMQEPASYSLRPQDLAQVPPTRCRGGAKPQTFALSHPCRRWRAGAPWCSSPAPRPTSSPGAGCEVEPSHSL